MRFGSKGLDAPTIIGIIVAIIIAITILYILWTRGMLPFAPAADRSLCLSELLDACAGTKALYQVSDACAGISDLRGPRDNPTACSSCVLESSTEQSSGCMAGGIVFTACCEYIRGLPS